MKKAVLWKTIGTIVLVMVASFLIYLWIPKLSLMGKTTKHKVYVAFGFHGNLYHSFRIDTNDEAGFGKDIRIIRKEIQVLDKYNKMGVPVKGVWDIENLFSLEETLPKHAPDIIRDLKRRVKDHGDEVIIMSYNNGLVSGMTPREFDDSIKRAITNEKGSGVKDLFARYSPIVRPQEMMTSPGNFSAYQKLGINSIVLYNSAITFDAFRVFVPELSLEDAHNPIWYHNKETKEKMIVIPAYNIGDLIENVSLKKWARDLHRAQLRGELKRDALIFINFDADDEYWYGYKLPAHLKSLPNTGGLDQLIASVKDVPYIEFTTIGEYLKNNPPQNSFVFGQDTADGSFNGYNSWSEKSYVHDYWTELMHDRRLHVLVKQTYQVLGENLPADVARSLQASYEKRLRLLSTTNFGMATPYLARARERVVEKLIADMKQQGQKALQKAQAKIQQNLARARAPQVDPRLTLIEKYYLLQTHKDAQLGSGAMVKVFVHQSQSRAAQKQSQHFYLVSQSGKFLGAVNVGKKKVGEDYCQIQFFVPVRNRLNNGQVYLYRGPAGIFGQTKAAKLRATPSVLANEFIQMDLNADGSVSQVLFKGKKTLEAKSLTPYIHYDHKYFRPQLQWQVVQDGQNGLAQVRLHGSYALRGVARSKPGHVEYVFSLIRGVPYLFFQGQITYPETYRDDIIKENAPALARKIDNRWIQVAPAELRFAGHADRQTPFKVLKRNYFDIESSYQVDYYQHSDKNLDLANINNHITAEYIAVAGKKGGVAVAMDTSVLANFAFAPMKMEHRSSEFKIKVNPFGTYFGEQYYQPTWGRGYGFEAAFITGQQYASAAKTYNGYTNRFSLMIGFFPGRDLPRKMRDDLVSFAYPPELISQKPVPVFKQKIDKVEAPAGFMAIYGDKGIFFHWERAHFDGAKYRLQVGASPGQYSQTLETSDTTLHWKGGQAGKKYYAVIQTIAPNGKKSPLSEQVSVLAQEPKVKKKGPQIPILLQLKILFAYLFSLIS